MGRAGRELIPAPRGPFAVCSGCSAKARRNGAGVVISRPSCREFHTCCIQFVETLPVLSSSPAWGALGDAAAATHFPRGFSQNHLRINSGKLTRDAIDILPAANSEDSYGVGCWSDLFGGFLPQPPLQPRRTMKRLNFWSCPAIGLVDGGVLERTAGKNKGALYPRLERRGFTAPIR